MVNYLFGTQITVILFQAYKWHHKFSQMEFHLYAGVDLWKILSLEIQQIISFPLLDLRNWLCGHWMDNRELQTMILCRLGQWLEIIHAWPFQNQMKNFCLLEQDLVISAHTRLKIKCLFLLKVYVHKVLKVAWNSKISRLYYCLLVWLAVLHLAVVTLVK